MNTTGILTAVDLMMGLIERATKIGAAVRAARAEGRDLTESELDLMFADDTAARDILQAEINKRRQQVNPPDTI